MKKYLSIALSVLTASIILSGCGKDDDMNNINNMESTSDLNSNTIIDDNNNTENNQIDGISTESESDYESGFESSSEFENSLENSSGATSETLSEIMTEIMSEGTTNS